MKSLGLELVKRRAEITIEMVDKFLIQMYRTDPDFLLTVRQCQTPVLILLGDIQAHPHATASRRRRWPPKAEVSMLSWKEPRRTDPPAVCQAIPFSGHTSRFPLKAA
jgi:hypothetical protein